MFNEMVDIKRQVAETSSEKHFRPYKINPPSDIKPPSTISNVELDVEEDEVSTIEEQTVHEEVIELQGMWDFILPDEEEQEAILVATRSRSPVDFPNTNSKHKLST